MPNINTGDRRPATIPDNTVLVYTEDDFGTFVSDEVTLVDDTIYRIMAPFVLSSGGLVIPAGATIEFQGTGQQVNDITYTNANKPFLRGASVDALKWTDLRVIFVSATQQLFDLTGAGTGPFQMEYGVFIGVANSGIGHITGFLAAVIRDTAFPGVPTWSGELLIKDNDTLLTDSGVFNLGATSNDALVAVESTAAHCFEFVNCRIIPLAGESAFRVSSAIQDAASRFVARDIISGTLGDFFDPSGLDEVDPRVNSFDNFGRSDSAVAAEANLDAGASTTVIPAIDAWVVVNGGTGWVSDEENRISFGTDGVAEVTSLEPKSLTLDGNVTMEPSTATKLLSATFIRLLKTDTAITFDNTTNTITAAGLTNGNTIIFRDTGGTLPAEIRSDVIYFIVGTADQLAYTAGGSAIAFTDDGTGSQTFDFIEFHGSRSQLSIQASSPLEISTHALSVFDTADKFMQVVRNRTDAVDIKVTVAYQRVSG